MIYDLLVVTIMCCLHGSPLIHNMDFCIVAMRYYATAALHIGLNNHSSNNK